MARRRDDDDEDDDLPRRRRSARDDDDEDDGDDRPKKPSRETAYTGLLAVTFAALAAACVVFYLDGEDLASQPLQPPTVTIPALGGGEAPKGGPAQQPPAPAPAGL